MKVGAVLAGREWAGGVHGARVLSNEQVAVPPLVPYPRVIRGRTIIVALDGAREGAVVGDFRAGGQSGLQVMAVDYGQAKLSHVCDLRIVLIFKGQAA